MSEKTRGYEQLHMNPKTVSRLWQQARRQPEPTTWQQQARRYIEEGLSRDEKKRARSSS